MCVASWQITDFILWILPMGNVGSILQPQRRALSLPLLPMQCVSKKESNSWGKSLSSERNADCVQPTTVSTRLVTGQTIEGQLRFTVT